MSTSPGLAINLTSPLTLVWGSTYQLAQPTSSNKTSSITYSVDTTVANSNVISVSSSGLITVASTKPTNINSVSGLKIKINQAAGTHETIVYTAAQIDVTINVKLDPKLAWPTNMPTYHYKGKGSNAESDRTYNIPIQTITKEGAGNITLSSSDIIDKLGATPIDASGNFTLPSTLKYGSATITATVSSTTDYAEATISHVFTVKQLTFKPVGTKASHDGENIVVELEFVEQGKVTEDFLQMKIIVMDTHPDNPGAEISSVYLTLKNVNTYIKYGIFDLSASCGPCPPQELTGTAAPKKFIINLPSGTASNVGLLVRENGNGLNDHEHDPLYLPIKKKPSAPSIVSENQLVKVTSSGRITINTTIKVTPVPNENVDKVFITVYGVAEKDGSSGVYEPFFISSLRKPFPGTTTPPLPTYISFDLVDGTTDTYVTEIMKKLVKLKPDSNVRISATCEANDLDGPACKPIDAIKASIRLPTPTLGRVKSLQDKKVSVSGNIVKGASITTTSGSTTTVTEPLYTIMAQALSQTAIEPATSSWRVTNIRNKTINSITFNDEVTTFADDSPLPLGSVIAFAVVQHYEQFISNNYNNRSIDTSTLTTDKQLNQSEPSAIKYAVTIAHVDKKLGLKAGSQTVNATTGALAFTPSFYDITNTSSLQDLTPPQPTVYTYKFTSVQKPKLKEPITKGSNSTEPPSLIPVSFFVDNSPIVGDLYTLSCDFYYPITPRQIKFMDPDTELPVVRDNATQIDLINLGSVFTQVKKSKSASEVPTFSYAELGIVKAGSTRQLAAYWSLNYDPEILILTGVDVQLGQGNCGGDARYGDGSDTDTSFVPLRHANIANVNDFVKTISVSKTTSNSDVFDSIIFSRPLYNNVPSLVQVSPESEFCFRVRPRYLDRGSNAEVLGNWWVTIRYSVPVSVLPAPTVVISKLASPVGKSFEVKFTIPSKDTIKQDAPQEWGTDWVALPALVTIKLFDSKGFVIKEQTVDYINDSGKKLLLDYYIKNVGPLVDTVSFLNLELIAGEVVYAEGYVTYYKKDTDPKSTSVVGAKSDRTLSYIEIPFAIKVTSVTLSQLPLTGNNVSGKRNVDEKLDTSKRLKVSAKVQGGASTGTVVKALIPAVGGNNIVSHQHDMIYNGTTDEWEVSDLTPVIDLNYSSNTSSAVLVVAYNTNSSNVVDFLFI